MRPINAFRHLAVVVLPLVAVAIAAGFVVLGGVDDAELPAGGGGESRGGGVPRGGGEQGAKLAETTSGPRLIFWTECDQIVALSNTELDEWRKRGVDGFACMVGRLQGFGGDQALSGEPDPGGPAFELQRRISDSRIVTRADARGMKLYLGAFLSNSFNTSTPLEDWFDRRGWSRRVLPKIGGLAAAAKRLGFAGVAFDQELYQQRGGLETATWAWDYPGNTHTEAEVRAKAERRGSQLMTTILDAFPRVELAVYHYSFPGDWTERVQEEVNGVEDAADRLLHIDFWDGMTSVEGYGAVRFFDNIFYKSPHLASWDAALTYNQNRTFATLSRKLSNWSYASRRVHVSPFGWIDPGPLSGPFDDARPAEYVRQQLLAFRKWSTGGEFANFVYGSLDGFDYSPYVPALQAASSSGEVDGVAPALDVTSAGPRSGAPRIEGIADDNLAIRVVRWRDDRGGSGAARMRWQVKSGDESSGYDGEMRWWVPAGEIASGATRVRVRAEDVKDNLSGPIVVPLR